MARPDLTNFALSPHIYTRLEDWRNCAALAAVAHRGLDKAQEWMGQSSIQVPVLVGEFGATANTTEGATFAYLVSHIISVNGQSWSWWDYDPYTQLPSSLTYLDGTTEKDSLAVEELKKNLRVYSGSEC
jgi:aryl-phospho-beta-D-glucosidase BglC (GH1 family)